LKSKAVETQASDWGLLRPSNVEKYLLLINNGKKENCVGRGEISGGEKIKKDEDEYE
jgi:hypothetical protein